MIDEADRMLDIGFIPDVRRIVYQTPRKRSRQTLFFSATFNDDVMNLAKQWTLDPIHVAIEPETVAAEAVEQRFWMLSSKDKRGHHPPLPGGQGRRRGWPGPSCSSTDATACTTSCANLQQRGFGLRGALGRLSRSASAMATINRFKEGEVPIVIATDVAGRGIHVEGINHVVNYDLPEDAEDYVHRIGRTGRAGATGTSISFVTENDAFNLPAIEAFLGHPVTCDPTRRVGAGACPRPWWPAHAFKTGQARPPRRRPGVRTNSRRAV